MLLSMTGQGQATSHSIEFGRVEVEVRTVNNRYLKVVAKVDSSLSSFEPLIEPILRNSIKRGSVQVQIRWNSASDQDGSSKNSLVDAEVVAQYTRELTQIAQSLQIAPPSLDAILQLPGVLNGSRAVALDEPFQAFLTSSVQAAIENLQAMREKEGRQMESEIEKVLRDIEANADFIESRAPQVLKDYESRLIAKVQQAFESAELRPEPTSLVREVQVYADRCDIREEIVRLRSHFLFFRQILSAQESQGRKLDFLVQELNREINTIGSKANDAEITSRVVLMKTAVEQIRELIQNVE
jgi:uncharacterized protein (TIGR00255 family)